jgi:hypothetical protein
MLKFVIIICRLIAINAVLTATDYKVVGLEKYGATGEIIRIN